MNSSSGFYRNGKWHDSTPPQSEPSPKGRGKYVSKTQKPGVKEAINESVKYGKKTIEETKEFLRSKGIKLKKSSVHNLLVRYKLGKRNKKRSGKKTPPSKTCKTKKPREDKP